MLVKNVFTLWDKCLVIASGEKCELLRGDFASDRSKVYFTVRERARSVLEKDINGREPFSGHRDQESTLEFVKGHQGQVEKERLV